MISDLIDEYSLALSYFQQAKESLFNLGKNVSKQRQRNAWAAARATEYLYSCLGGCVSIISVGGAMVNQSHIDLLTRILPCQIYQGYGSTEGGGLAIASHGEDQLMPMRNIKFRVESRPELGYTMEDKPFPRGELLILGKETAGADDWFGDDETVSMQKRKYSSDGFYCTGDIVEYHPNTKTFRIVDRASSLVKLPDGVFFSPHRVEMAIGDLNEFGVTGHLVTAATHGTVVLVLEMRHGTRSDDSRILMEVQTRCKKAGLAPRCIPRRLMADRGMDGESPGSVSGRLWQEVGCYTVSGKLSRAKVLRRIHSQLQQIDKDLAKTFLPLEPTNHIRTNDDIETETALALLDSIGITYDGTGDKNPILSSSLVSIGVDSLLWAKLRTIVRQMLSHRGQNAVKVPFFDLSKNSLIDIARWTNEVVKRRGQIDKTDPTQLLGNKEVKTNEPRQPTCDVANVSSPLSPKTVMEKKDKLVYDDGKCDEEEVRRAEFKDYAHNIDKLEAALFRLVDKDLPSPLAKSQPQCNISANDSKRVLLTGATGFLGRHTLSTLLAKGAEVVCLIRGNSAEETLSRVILGMAKAGLSSSNALDRLEIVLGDLSKPLFGLEQRDYNRLASSIDVIIHTAAVVKMWSLNSADGDAHDMIYTNTQSCVSIARLSAHARDFGRNAIPVLYTSTKSVESGISPDVVIEEAGLHYSSAMLRRQPYSMSKLLGETVLLHGNRSVKNSLCIMRPPLLTFSADGDSNDSDWFVRLPFTISDLGLSPSKGKSEFLERQMRFEPVDTYAKKVVDEAFSLPAVSNSPFGTNIIWSDAFDVENRPMLCLLDILDSLTGSIEPVPTFAFRSAVLSEDQAPPFFPLVESLLHNVDEGYVAAAESPIEGKGKGACKIPEVLRVGLSAFLDKRCPGIVMSHKYLKCQTKSVLN